MTTRNPTLRRAAPADLDAVEKLLTESELPTAGVRDALDNFVIVEVAGRIEGVAGLEIHGSDGVLRSVAVAPSLRGTGVGAQLTERILDLARSRELRHVYLLTTTAEGYFPRHGFRRIAREDASADVQQSVEFREACPASAVTMVLDLE